MWNVAVGKSGIFFSGNSTKNNKINHYLENAVLFYVFTVLFLILGLVETDDGIDPSFFYRLKLLFSKYFNLLHFVRLSSGHQKTVRTVYVECGGWKIWNFFLGKPKTQNKK
jgi:hypothetical protein